MSCSPRKFILVIMLLWASKATASCCHTTGLKVETWTPPPPAHKHGCLMNLLISLSTETGSDYFVCLMSGNTVAALKIRDSFWHLTAWYGVCCLCIQSRGIPLPWRWKKHVFPKRLYLSTKVRCVILRNIFWVSM